MGHTVIPYHHKHYKINTKDIILSKETKVPIPYFMQTCDKLKKFKFSKQNDFKNP